MSISKLAILICVILAMGYDVALSVVAGCDVTKYAVPGDTFTLTGPTPPTGVTYYYLWTIKDTSGSTVKTATDKVTTYTIPTPATVSYVATLSVGSGTATSGAGLTGCVLQSCLTINVQLTNTCALSGASSVCQTDSNEAYKYMGNAAINGTSQTAYLNWIVDTTAKTQHDTTGTYIVDWTTFYTGAGSPQAHSVTVEVYSLKSNTLLSSCTYPVTVLPSPVTTITPT
jgi:hypothetical protein